MRPQNALLLVVPLAILLRFTAQAPEPGGETSVTPGQERSIPDAGLAQSSDASAADPETTPPDFKVAFIGDQGLGREALAVLELIRQEGARAVVHAGDFDYRDDPSAWDAQIDGVLGADFPYFATIGNHDRAAWGGPTGYQERLTRRFRRAGVAWDGDLGIRSSFRFNGIFFVLTAPGIYRGDNGAHAAYIRDRLAADRSIWSVSVWHKSMRAMQTGNKGDETGWAVYDESAKGGAIIIAGHEHSYARTHLLSAMPTQTVASTSDTLHLTRGHSFVAVSGLGGRSPRPQRRSGPWWARIYASKCLPRDRACEPNATAGALFGTFNLDGVPNRAMFYFKDIDGRIVDHFTVISQVESVPLMDP